MGLAKGVAESLKNPVARGMLEYFTESVWQVGFARSLSFHNAAEVTSVSPQGMEMVYRVPENICVQGGVITGDCNSKSGEGAAFLPCGVTTALFDEVSTLAMVVADRTYRPGVSISLSCQNFHPVSPGEMVTFKSRGLKMGARLGYGEASMYREDGKLAARGRHVKYLPMGSVWDLTSMSLLFPLARKLSAGRHEKWMKDAERVKGIPAGEHLMDMFRLEEFERYQSEPEAASPTPNPGQYEDGSGGVSYGAGGASSAEAQVLVTKRQCNYMPGTFHGGAIAVAAEEIARRCPPPSIAQLAQDSGGNSGPAPDPRVQYMEVHYMSAIKRRAGLAAVSTSVDGKGTEVTRVGLSEAGGAGGGALSSEAVLIWGEAGTK